MRRIVAVALMLSLVVGVGGSATRDAARAEHGRPPNVLLIVTDDQRAFGTLHVMRDLQDRLIDRGIRFPRAYATTPQCCPSRASIMTGQYAHNHGVNTNRQGGNLDHSTTIQRHLSDAGYTTGLVGKLLTTWKLEDRPPYFDDFSLFQRGYYGTRFNINGTLRNVRAYSTDFIADRAKRFIRKAEKKDSTPWYLYVATWAPHEASTPEERYRDKRVGPLEKNPAMKERDCSDKPPMADCFYNPRVLRKDRVRAMRTLFSVDDLIEQIDQMLTATNEERDTLVIFMSDNGYMWGEHGFVGKKPPYRGGIEIPLVLRWPGHFDRGVTDQRIVANIDIAPTIYDAAGITPEAVVDGHSLLDDDWWRERLLLEFTGNRGFPDWASTLSRSGQFTDYYTYGGVVYTEMYRLLEDPWQLTNVLGDDDSANDPPPEEVTRARAQLNADRECAGETCP